MSESGHFTSKEVLTDRKLRKLEVLTYVSLDPLLPYKRVGGWLSTKQNALNEGNSVRQMKIYLQEFAFAGFGEFDGDYYHLTESGKGYIKQQLDRTKGWFKPIEFMRAEIQRLKESFR